MAERSSWCGSVSKRRIGPHRRWPPAALIVGAAPPARAEPACDNTIDPDDLGERTFCVAERLEISARAGDKFHAQGRLVLEDSEARLLVSDGLRCEPPGGRQ